jgi:CheY-like chemotaxis protein
MVAEAHNGEKERARAAKILVVDDDPHMQEGVRVALSRGSYEIVVATNGIKAMEALDKQEFDLIVTDQKMPNMSGIELLTTLQKREPP